MKALWLFVLTVFLLVAGCTKNEDQGRIPEADPEMESSGEAGIFALTQALEEDPQNPDYYYRRSSIYYRTGNMQPALRDINAAIQINKGKSEYYFHLARIHYAMHNNTMALKSSIAAEELKSIDPELYILMSQIYMDLRDDKRSEEYLNKAASIAPHHTDLFVLKARIYATKGDTASAVSNLFSALKKDVHHLISYKELVRIYQSSRKHDSAMVFLTAGRALSPRDPFFYYHEGRFFESVNLKQAALKSYETALKVDSTYYLAYYNLGLIAYKKEDFPGALKNFINVVKYEPGQKEANLYAAELYEKNNQGYEAIPYYERVRATDSTNVKAKEALEKLYLQYPSRKIIPAKDSVPVLKTDSTNLVKKDSVTKPVNPVQQRPVQPVTPRRVNPQPVRRDSSSTGNTTNTLPREEVKKDTVK
ncbi:MAG: tetratricopeptide repeat protein [Cytophagaceae bacterium]